MHARWSSGLLVLAGMVLGACAGGEEGDDLGAGRAELGRTAPSEPAALAPRAAAENPPAPTTERGPTRAQTEPTPPSPPAPMRRRVAVIALSLTPVEVSEGEDGRGESVSAEDPLALDLRAPEGFPGRARDPVLQVGSLRFHRYSHPAPDTLRFVVASRSMLPDGARVTLQYGDDRASRVVVTEALEVPR